VVAIITILQLSSGLPFKLAFEVQIFSASVVLGNRDYRLAALVRDLELSS